MAERRVQWVSGWTHTHTTDFSDTDSLLSHCPEHEWSFHEFTPNKYSVFAVQQDQSCGQDDQEVEGGCGGGGRGEGEGEAEGEGKDKGGAGGGREGETGPVDEGERREEVGKEKEVVVKSPPPTAVVKVCRSHASSD